MCLGGEYGGPSVLAGLAWQYLHGLLVTFTFASTSVCFVIHTPLRYIVSTHEYCIVFSAAKKQI